MQADHRAQVDELLADYRRSREQLGAVHRALAAVSASVTSEDRLVTVTVGAQGQLTGLVIVESAYRTLRPHELAARIVELTAAAAAKVTRAAGEVLAPVLPRGTDPEALLRGTADLTRSEVKPAARNAVDSDETFENLSWIRPGGER
ncbi:YbaB/EbfC family nucleoid-associated protein [Actinophytocola gossypii]|uniref:YbaB/EbfC family nucleoid-associated protein n=1 Tax=Actinophytocola gossypii TaxID=2812003 RepID=UPI0021A76078|nr:YbaB/EbfC family nucleoid-associated protein [Actinophytocola gossypii]